MNPLKTFRRIVQEIPQPAVASVVSVCETIDMQQSVPPSAALSFGHIGFFGGHELFETPKGYVYAAPSSAPIASNGYRSQHEAVGFSGQWMDKTLRIAESKYGKRSSNP